MTPATSLTPRDLEILLALVQKVRVFSLRQIARHWWGGELANARRRLKMLLEADLVCRVAILARPLPPFHSPVLTWQPVQPVPNLGHVAHHLQTRWRGRPVRPTTGLIATPRAAQLLGGKARGDIKCGTQATHDLGVAAIWLRFHVDTPAWAAAWRSEDLMAHTRRGQKLPDAFLVDESGHVFRVIEFGGAYNTTRVAAFHEDCASRSLAYEIW